MKNIKIINGKKYITEIETGIIQKKTQRLIATALFDYGSRITNDLHRVITTGTRTGRVYTIRGRQHQSSAAGEPPANLSGKLSKSFEYKVTGAKQMIVGSTAFSNRGAPYPLFLDQGTSKMQPRPFFEITNKNSSMDLYRELQKI